MKAHYHRVPGTTKDTFTVRHDVTRTFTSIWHYHPQLELHCVVQGEGVRFVGDTISNFSAGEIILLGENLPHNWQGNEAYFRDDPSARFEAIVIHFFPNWLGADFLNTSEALPITKLYEKARRGLLLQGELVPIVRQLMDEALRAAPLDRVIILLSILKHLAQSDSIQPLASSYGFYQSNEQETVRLNTVCNYTLANYTREITLEDIAAIAHLSVTSFCRYFKMMTRKTYFQFLIEVRISFACRSLTDNQLPIEVICYESGFNNLSNFYRQFKKVQGVSPLEYKKKYLNLIVRNQ
ncbi:AraC family transcriptional regulator [Spirosoma utsteinense]|uniref:AraC-like DNA-binding protein n=1 Tax=Spirosoma utsteinense TaxID=2585773 RepID=A0ABR6WFJ0_9BACT|nr:AraC family transcriptional regulator [Spirosoma utsteinense]MBC3789409.1 AraC-like DNA-binding protein [Spirosoma utsteinense]MBC3795315.1 AraC-like DNA-binding protein [Spirosoma utsteinense]